MSSKRQSKEEEEEEENRKKENRQNWAHFVVVCFLTNSSLVKSVAEIKRKFKTEQKLDLLTPIQHLLFGISLEEKKKMASQYWDPHIQSNSSGIDERKLGSSLIIQAFMKHVVLAKRLVRLHTSVIIGEIKIEILQSAVRAWRYKRLLLEKAKKKLQDETSFHLFCKEMLDGIEVYMFGRKYGGMPKRKIAIDAEGECLYYSTRFLNVRKIELNSIYEVVKGHSGYPYQRAKPVHRSWCLHLKILGGKIIDLEACTSSDYTKLYHGFCRLRFLLSTKAPFYVDQFGTACRAGPSVVLNALNHTPKLGKPGSKSNPDGRSPDEDTGDNIWKRERSEADKWRYFSALQSLSREYASCQAQKEQASGAVENEGAENEENEDEQADEDKDEDAEDDDFIYSKEDDGGAPQAYEEEVQQQTDNFSTNITSIGRKSLAFVGLK